MRLEDWLDDRCYEAKLEGIREGMHRGILLLYERLISKGYEEDKAMKETAETYQLSVEEIKSILTERIS